MGFIEKNGTNKLNAYLTQRGRELLLNGNKEDSIASFFILGDSDRNYNVSTEDRIKYMLVPDLTGDKTESLHSVATNTIIKSTVGVMKETEDAGEGYVKKHLYAPSPDMESSEIKMVDASRIDSFIDEQKTMMGNLYKTFNLPITTTDKDKYTSGEFFNTAFEGFNADEIVVIEIPKNFYGEMIDGKTIHLSIPNRTNTNYEIYSTFLQNPLISDIGNQLFSDPNKVSEEFGGEYKIAQLPAQENYPNPREGYSSNVAYLFCDAIQRPQNNPRLTWANSGNYFVNQEVGENKVKDKYDAILRGNNKDKAVGIAYLDKGFLVITDKTIISNLINKKPINVVGTNNVVKQYYIEGATLKFSSFKTEFIQHIVCLCLPNEFYTTTNNTYDPNSNRSLAITEVGLYNNSYELIAIAKPDRPLPKDRYSVLSFDIYIRV